MDKNKIIIDNCPNYYKIINFDYFEEDYFTANLIKVYHSYIFCIDVNNKDEMKKIRLLDKALNKYIDDYSFRREMKHQLIKVTFKKDIHILNNLINAIIRVFVSLEDGKTKRIYVSHWI